jgi:hypothetical protein
LLAATAVAATAFWAAVLLVAALVALVLVLALVAAAPVLVVPVAGDVVWATAALPEAMAKTMVAARSRWLVTVFMMDSFVCVWSNYIYE